MAILMLHCSILPPVFPRLEAMLAELAEPKVIVLPAEMAQKQSDVFRLYDQVIPIDGKFMDSTLVELAAFDAHASTKFSRVAGTGELGVLRAARLRAALELPGQSIASALAYRDKVLMKTLCAQRGIRVPRFCAIDGPSDLLGFVRSVGLPIVLKPRAGAGSIDARLIKTQGELRAVMERLPAATLGLSMGLIAEEFISGQMYTVNGYATPLGDIRLAWPASYMERGNLDIVLNDGCVSGEYLLAQEDPLVARMQAFTESCLRALPWPADGFAFHLELFLEDATGDLILCEVACRQGGANISDVYEFAFGINLLEASLRLQLGLPVPAHQAVPRPLTGAVRAPVRNGTFVLSSSGPPPFPWILKHEVHFASGIQAKGAKSSVDCCASFVTQGKSSVEILSRLKEVNQWFESISSWRTDPVDQPSI